ncbi:MAG: 50S ribosomal protein L20 [Defluviitaleaceae bacterium]|nr:50S ribosomal protein L20 [Defluviitaleaceae bacterium]
MARVKNAMTAKKKHVKTLKLAKGYYGARSRQYKTAKQAVMRAMAHSYIGRKQLKRDYRRLWITRINAAARINGMSYSRFMNGLKVSGVNINRKMLAEIAIHDAPAFTELVQTAKAAL